MKLSKLLVALFFVTVIVLLHKFHITSYCSLSVLHENIDSLRAMVAQHYIFMVASYIVLHTLATALAIPGCIFFTTTSGVLFGVFPALLYANIAVTIGSTLLFLTVRYILGSWIQKKCKNRLDRFNNEIAVHGYYYMIFVRLLGVLPTFLVNILSGLTLLPVRTFVWTTFIGMIPISLFYACAGQQLAHCSCFADFCTPAGLFGLSLFVVPKVVLAPLMIRIIRKRKKQFLHIS